MVMAMVPIFVLLPLIVLSPFALCIYLGFQAYPIWRVAMLGVRVHDGITSAKDDPSWTWIFAIAISAVMSLFFVLGLRAPSGVKYFSSLMRYMIRMSNYFLGSAITLFTICIVYEIVAAITYTASNYETSLYSGNGAMISFVVIVVSWLAAMVFGVLNVLNLRVENITIKTPKIKEKVRITHISGK